MIELKVRNVHSALPAALHLLHTKGVERGSRNGSVLVLDEPVATVYTNPCERVIFHPWRDANPFFHFYESLWMLAGRNDVAPLARYAKRMATFSDNGETFNAAYGRRWRWAHDCMGIYRDQLVTIAEMLERNPNERRAVLQIWDHQKDLGYTGKDAACNMMATFQVNSEGKLDMVVFCRSNDIVWGCYGANAVHFSMLLEYVAARANYRVGTYTQISVNWHGYADTAGPLLEHHTADEVVSPYETEPVYAYPICDGQLDSTWDDDCQAFVTDDGRLPSSSAFKNRFFADVAWPLVNAHDLFKSGKLDEAVNMTNNIEASDWSMACREWLERRVARRKKAEDDGVHGVTP
jgi:hypothetical protein